MQALRHFIVEVGKGAEDSSTGKPIRPQLVEKLHSQDVLKEEKLICLRLKSIELRNKHASAGTCSGPGLLYQTHPAARRDRPLL